MPDSNNGFEIFFKMLERVLTVFFLGVALLLGCNLYRSFYVTRRSIESVPIIMTHP